MREVIRLKFNLSIIKDMFCNINNIISLKALIIVITFIIFHMFLKKFKIKKMDVKQIVKDHIKTLKNSNSNKLNISEILFFFIFPLILSLLLTWKKILSSGDMSSVITAFSIFAGLLFNLLVLTLDMVRKIKNGRMEEQDASSQNIKEQLIKETYTNISFCIMLSLALLCLSFFFVIGITNYYIKIILSIFIYWLVTTFILTLLMVLKRIYTLLSEEFR